MHIEAFRNLCLSLPETTEGFPFDQNTLVFKVCNKMFALTGLDNPVFSVNLKCDPQRAIELREEHEEIQPGYHMSKKHWNTVNFEGDLTDQMLTDLILHSYQLVVNTLKKADKERILALYREWEELN